MKQNFLFPRKFRIFGWPISIISAALGIVLIYTDSSLEPQLLGNFSDEIASIGLIIGLLLLGFSRLKIEDEMIYRFRLESLQISLYINYSLLILCILMFYDFDFLQVLTYNMFTTLIVFNIRFHWLLYRSNS